MIQEIRKASMADLDRLMEIFERARTFMKQTGNPNQWIDGYPSREFMAHEIEKEFCHVCTDENRQIVATFCFIAGPDPTYAHIEQGEWPSDEPYHVIHRLASDGTCQGVASACFEWCSRHANSLRADTHADNKVMQHLLEKNGFKRCGIIYVANGTQRIAFQKSPI